MPCTVHAIWKPFKETIRPRLPKKSGGVLLKSYGAILTTFFITPDVLHFLSTKYLVTSRIHDHGLDYVYMHWTWNKVWAWQITSSPEGVLADKKVKRHLSADCISAILKYGDAIMCKENFLSNHHCMYITNCMDSATTSPVESQNQIVHGHLGVHTNLNTEKGIERMTNTQTKRQRNHKVRACKILCRLACLLNLLLVNTTSYKAKEFLIKIMIPVRNLSYVVLGRPVGIVGVLVPLIWQWFKMANVTTSLILTCQRD